MAIARSAEKHRNWLHLVIVFVGPNPEQDRDAFLGMVDDYSDFISTLELPNLDPGMARFSGTKIADTEWVVYWDDDDYPMLDALKETTNHTRPDVLVVGQYILDIDKKEMPRLASSTKTVDELMIDTGLWRILIPTSVASRADFIRSRLGEDKFLLSSLINLKCQFHFSSEIFYCYRKNSNSLTTFPHIQDALLTINGILRFIMREDLVNRDQLLLMFFSISVSVITQGNLQQKLEILIIASVLVRIFRVKFVVLLIRFMILRLKRIPEGFKRYEDS